MKKKVIGLVFTIILSMSCIISVYGNEDDEIARTSADDIVTYSSSVISSMTAGLSINTNYYSGSANMLLKGSGTLKIYLWKMNSDGTHTTVDKASTTFTNKTMVSLSDYYNMTFNSGTYKCRAQCVATNGTITETMVCTSASATR